MYRPFNTLIRSTFKSPNNTRMMWIDSRHLPQPEAPGSLRRVRKGGRFITKDEKLTQNQTNTRTSSVFENTADACRSLFVPVWWCVNNGGNHVKTQRRCPEVTEVWGETGTWTASGVCMCVCDVTSRHVTSRGGYRRRGRWRSTRRGGWRDWGSHWCPRRWPRRTSRCRCRTRRSGMALVSTHPGPQTPGRPRCRFCSYLQRATDGAGGAGGNP